MPARQKMMSIVSSQLKLVHGALAGWLKVESGGATPRIRIRAALLAGRSRVSADVTPEAQGSHQVACRRLRCTRTTDGSNTLLIVGVRVPDAQAGEDH